MTHLCPPERELLLLVNSEQTENRAALLSKHAEGCGSCQSTLDSWKDLQQGIAADVPNLGPQSTANAVMRRIRSGESPPARGRWLRAWHLGLGSAVAAAAVILLVIVGERSSNNPERFQARSASTGSELARKVGADFYAMRDGALAKLGHDHTIGLDEGLTLSYINSVRDESVYMLAFVVDSESEIHWLYPAFTDANTDPQAIELRTSDQQIVLPETVQMDAPATGAGSLVWIASTERRAVSSVEKTTRQERTVDALVKRWPGSEVGHVRVRIERRER